MMTDHINHNHIIKKLNFCMQIKMFAIPYNRTTRYGGKETIKETKVLNKLL